MGIPEAIEVQRRMLDGLQKQFASETSPGKRDIISRRIKSMYVSMACMALMEGSGIENKIDSERVNGTGGH